MLEATEMSSYELSLSTIHQKAQNDYTQLLDDIERAKEEKENKQRYLSGVAKQTVEQREKIARADKSLHKAQKDIQNLYFSKTDDTILLQQREVEVRELQQKNALVLQDIAEFTIRHVEAEAYVKKLLMAKKIELPCFLPSTRSSVVSPGESSAASAVDQPLKSGSRMSNFASSRESIGSVITIEPQFDNESAGKISKSTRSDPYSTKATLSKRSVTHKQQLQKK